jgi:GTP-binding protein
MVMQSIQRKPKSVFQQFITDYFEKRATMCAFVLIDIHEAKLSIFEFTGYMKVNSVLYYIFPRQTKSVK